MVFDQVTSRYFCLFSPSIRALSGQGAREPHWDGPHNTLAPFHLSHDTTLFLPRRVFLPHSNVSPKLPDQSNLCNGLTVN